MSKQIIQTKNAPEPIGPYNQAIYVNNSLYVSGQIALDVNSGKLINNDIVAETRQVMKNVGAILNEAGLGYSHIIKCSIFIRNMSEFSTINKVYGEYFEENPPTRETVEVSRLPKDANIEISCIAVP